MFMVLSSEATSDSISNLSLVIWSPSNLTSSLSLSLSSFLGVWWFYLFQHVLFIHGPVLFIIYYYPGA